jgi:hypothetical protein
LGFYKRIFVVNLTIWKKINKQKKTTQSTDYSKLDSLPKARKKGFEREIDSYNWEGKLGKRKERIKQNSEDFLVLSFLVLDFSKQAEKSTKPANLAL